MILRWMTWIVRVALGVFLGVWICAVAWADLGLQDVRIAQIDVDGDGVLEVIAGGRIGPALAFDVPFTARQAGVGVYRVSGQLLQPICKRNDLYVVRDVGGGDVDGDGVDEVVTVGMGVLKVFDVLQGTLVEIAHVPLGNDWTDRVLVDDTDGDGRVEVGVIGYRIDVGAEIGQSEVVFWEWMGGGLQHDYSFVLDGHIGDLCAVLAEDGQRWVAAEVGMGDEGGDIHILSPQGQVLWQTPITDDRIRALSLDARQSRLAVGGINGQVWGVTLTPQGLVRQDLGTRVRGFSSLIWDVDRLLLFSKHTGLHFLRF